MNLAYSLLAALTGGYVAAWIAARQRLQHAIALAALVLVLSVVSAIAFGNRQPRFYQVALAVLMPAAVVGGGWQKRWLNCSRMPR